MQLTVSPVQRYKSLNAAILSTRPCNKAKIAELEKGKKDIISELKTSVISGTSNEFNSAVHSVTVLLTEVELTPFLHCASEISERLDRKDILDMIPALELLEAISKLPEMDTRVSINRSDLINYAKEFSTYICNAFFYRELTETGERESFERSVHSLILIDASFAVTQLFAYLKVMMGKAEQKLRVERPECQNTGRHAQNIDSVLESDEDYAKRRSAELERLFNIADSLPKKYVIAGSISMLVRLIELAHSRAEVLDLMLTHTLETTIESAKDKIAQLVS